MTKESTIQLWLEFSMKPDEMKDWQSENIAAFFEGIRKIIDAKNAEEVRRLQKEIAALTSKPKT